MKERQQEQEQFLSNMFSILQHLSIKNDSSSRANSSNRAASPVDSSNANNPNNNPNNPNNNNKAKMGSAQGSDSDSPQIADVICWTESFDNLLNSKRNFFHFFLLNFSYLFFFVCKINNN